MRTSMGFALVASCLAVATPLEAAVPSASDPCGDVVLRAHVDDVGTTSVPDPRQRPLDIRALSFASVYEPDQQGEPVFLGVDVSLHLCTAAELPQPGEGFRVSWRAEPSPGGQDECTESVFLFNGRVLGSLDTYVEARFERACVPPDSLPGSGYTYSDQQQLSYLQDVALSGDTMTWKLRVARLEPHVAARVAVGKVWREPRALTRGTDGQDTTSTIGPGGVSVTFGALADEAGPGTDFVVGC